MSEADIPAGTEFRAISCVGRSTCTVLWKPHTDVPRSYLPGVWGDLIDRLLSENPGAKNIRLERDGN